MEQFAKLKDGFLKRYFLVAPHPTHYFQDNYMNRVEKWVMCFRQFDLCNMDTNMFVESFHKKTENIFYGTKTKRAG